MNSIATRRCIYVMFALMVALLVCSSAALLWDSVTFAAGDGADSPRTGLVLLSMLALLGLHTGGLTLVIDESPNGRLALPLLSFVVVGWLLAAASGVMVLLAGLSDDPRWFAVPEFVLTAAVLLVALRALPGILRAPHYRLARFCWIALAMDAALTLLLILLAPQTSTAHLIASLRLFTVQTGAAITMGFWLMHRFSNITPGWRNQGLVVVVPLLSITGALLAFAGESRLVGYVAAATAPLAWMLAAAHSYRALSDRNSSRTLAAHWYTLALILWLAALVILGVPGALPELSPWIDGTHLTHAQTALAAWAVVAVGLGLLNQSVAEMRGENRRVTGLMPFWFVAFGLLVSALALGGAGLVQVYLVHVFEHDAMTVHDELRALFGFLVIGQAAVFTGAVIYALGFYARRLRQEDQP